MYWLCTYLAHLLAMLPHTSTIGIDLLSVSFVHIYGYNYAHPFGTACALPINKPYTAETRRRQVED